MCVSPTMSPIVAAEKVFSAQQAAMPAKIHSRWVRTPMSTAMVGRRTCRLGGLRLSGDSCCA